METLMERLLPNDSVERIKQAGLHKIIGAMYGVDELNIKEAVELLGAMTYMHMEETKKTASAIRAFRALRGEKVADAAAALDALGAAGMRALPAGIGGALLLRAMNNNPETMDRDTAIGGGAGLLGGAAAGLFRGMSRAPGAASEIAQQIRSM